MSYKNKKKCYAIQKVSLFSNIFFFLMGVNMCLTTGKNDFTFSFVRKMKSQHNPFTVDYAVIGGK